MKYCVDFRFNDDEYQMCSIIVEVDAENNDEAVEKAIEKMIEGDYKLVPAKIRKSKYKVVLCVQMTEDEYISRLCGE